MSQAAADTASLAATDTAPSAAARRVIAVDLDEVLGQFVAALVLFHNTAYSTTLREEDFNSYKFSDVWGGTDEDAARKVHEFFDSVYFKEHIHVVPGSLEALQQLGATCDLYIVTSRQHVIAEDTRRWVSQHFPGVFKGVLFGNHWGLNGEKRSKAAMCKEIGACVLVDDSVQYAAECAAVLESVLLFGDYAWNQHPEDGLPTNVHRVRTWAEVVEQITSLK